MVNKNAVELVTNQNSLGFYNWLFLVPKPNNQWRPILDLSISTLNTFLNTESFKMETPETIRDIPIHSQSRKYMHFHLHGRSYQFKALPFSLSTAPMEFTVVTKEVKLMALQRGIGIHQYLDDWLLRPSNLSPAFRDLSSSLSRTWLAGEQGEVRTGSKTGFYCVNTTYLVDRCICPAPCRSRQTLEKNVLSWALAGTGSVLFTRQVAVQPTCRYTAHACACALPLFVWRHFKKVVKRFTKRRFTF